MSLTVCLAARTLNYPKAGGHLWVYLNWVLGFRALGCRVIWLEPVAPDTPVSQIHDRVQDLKRRLDRYGLADALALCSFTDDPIPINSDSECIDIEEVVQADLLLDVVYGLPASLVRRFRRSAMLDIDPGLLQIWMSKGQINVGEHDTYFTIGETVGQSGSPIPDCGIKWQYTPPCTALEWWPHVLPTKGASFTTVSNWFMDEWIEREGAYYQNDKRSGFLPFLELPKYTNQSLNLALCMGENDENERMLLRKKGWKVSDAWEITSTPWDYQEYIQSSLGEFSCVKPSCIQLQNAWISDRTLCYLATGRPAVIQHTGPSRFLPDDSGLFRFHDLKEAASCLEKVAADYDQQCKLARAVTEEFFDARKVVKYLLERAMA